MYRYTPHGWDALSHESASNRRGVVTADRDGFRVLSCETVTTILLMTVPLRIKGCGETACRSRAAGYRGSQ
jgi:hypothetical protein